MSTTTRFILGLVIGLIAATIVSVMQTGALFNPVLLIAFIVATTAGTLLGLRGQPSVQKPRQRKAKSDEASVESSSDGDREFGLVKWFNVSKGFGFIVRDGGEEIFVHFRSIQGKGRRGLKDGQRVSFVVVENDKGPQAEDVAPED
jgi:CspA family cold shock protein